MVLKLISRASSEGPYSLPLFCESSLSKNVDHLRGPDDWFEYCYFKELLIIVKKNLLKV